MLLAEERSEISNPNPNSYPIHLYLNFSRIYALFCVLFPGRKKIGAAQKMKNMRYVWWWFTLFSRILILSEKSFEEVLIIIVMIADYPAVRWEGVQFAHFGLWILSWAAVTNNEETRVREHLLKKEYFLSGIASKWVSCVFRDIRDKNAVNQFFGSKTTVFSLLFVYFFQSMQV